MKYIFITPTIDSIFVFDINFYLFSKISISIFYNNKNNQLMENNTILILLIFYAIIGNVWASVTTITSLSSGPYSSATLSQSRNYIFMVKSNTQVTICQNTQKVLSCPTTLSTTHTGKILALDSSPDDQYLATGGEDYRIFTYYLGNGTTICQLYHNGQVLALKFDPINKEILYSAGSDKTIRKWNLTSCTQLISKQLSAPIIALHIKYDSTQIVVAQNSLNTSIVSTLDTSLTITSTSSLHTLAILNVFYTKIGNLVVSVGEDGNINLMNGGTLISSHSPAFSFRGVGCNTFSSQNLIQSSNFFLCCIDVGGIIKTYLITSTTIAPIFSYATTFVDPLFVIGKQITDFSISFTYAESNQLRTLRIDEDSTALGSCSTYFITNSSNYCSFCYKSVNQCLICTSNSVCGTCIDGYYKSGSNCVKCISPCSSCSASNSCDACEVGYQRQGNNCQSPNNLDIGCIQYTLNNNKCLYCRNQYYLNAGTNCILCSTTLSNCISCSSSSTCKMCQSGYYLNGGNTCQYCNTSLPGCSICSNSTDCLICTNYYKIVGSNTQCSDCSPTCLTCIVYYDVCSACRPTDNRTLSGDKCPCSYGYFETVANNPCSSCLTYLTNCETCSSQTTCTLCLPTFYYIVRGGKTECEVCLSKCATCSNSYNNCTSCDTNNYYRILNGTNCVCKSGYIETGTDTCQTCQDLLNGCTTCSNQTYCNTCSTGYLILAVNASNQYCVTCHYTCNTCTIANGTVKCASCPPSSFRTYNSTSKQCPCNSGYFDDNSTVTCLDCTVYLTNCQLCTNRTFCTSCSGGKFLDRSYRSCENCKSICTSCSVFFDSCVGCQSGNNRVLSGDQCVCNGSAYAISGTDVCQDCSINIPHCTQCTSAGLRCTKCQTNYLINEQFSKCRTCSQVISGCNTCIRQGECLGCFSPFSLYLKKCLCPNDMYTSENDFGQCRNFHISGIKSKMVYQTQIHQHNSNQIITFVRFSAVELTVSGNISSTIRIFINDIQINGSSMELDLNIMRIRTPIKEQYVNTKIRLKFSNNSFFNEKQFTLTSVEQQKTISKIYYYSQKQINFCTKIGNIITTIVYILKWVVFVALALGFIRFLFPIVVFLQIIPIFLFLPISLPASLNVILKSFLAFQIKSITIANLSIGTTIHYPPLTLHYYGFIDYILIAKFIDFIIIAYISLVTHFNEGIVRMFPIGNIKIYLTNNLIRKGYAVRSLTILALQPSLLLVSSAYLSEHRFTNLRQIFNYISCLFILGFYLIYNFNHAANLSQAKLIKNVSTADCYCGLNYQETQATKIMLLSHLRDFFTVALIFFFNTNVYFALIILINLILLFLHFKQNLYQSKSQMGIRICGIVFYISFFICMFVLNLSQTAFILTHQSVYIISYLCVISIAGYILMVSMETVIVQLIGKNNKIDEIKQKQIDKKDNKKQILTLKTVNNTLNNSKEMQKIANVTNPDFDTKQKYLNVKYTKSSKNIRGLFQFRERSKNKAYDDSLY